MSDNRTNEELLTEIELLKNRIKTLEGEPLDDASVDDDAKREVREVITTQIEFIGEFDVLEARGINISEGGVCFLLSDPLAFDMKFTSDDKIEQHRGHLVWVKKVDGEGFHFGIKFVNPELDSDIPVIT